MTKNLQLPTWALFSGREDDAEIERLMEEIELEARSQEFLDRLIDDREREPELAAGI